MYACVTLEQSSSKCNSMYTCVLLLLLLLLLQSQGSTVIGGTICCDGLAYCRVTKTGNNSALRYLSVTDYIIIQTFHIEYIDAFMLKHFTSHVVCCLLWLACLSKLWHMSIVYSIV
jgi:cation transport ATPase